MVLTSAIALAQPVFISEANYNPYDPNKSPLWTWNGASFASSNVMVGQAFGQVKSFLAANGKTYVVAITAYNFFTFEFLNGLYLPLGQTGFGSAGTAQMVLSPDCTRAYVLTANTGELFPVNISDLTAPTLGTPIQVASSGTGWHMDIRPQGDRIILVGYNSVVRDVDLATGSVATLALNLPHYAPAIRVSPNGSFAYFALDNTAHDIVVLNTATYPSTLLKVEPGPGNFGMNDLAFHPTLPRAYFMPSAGATSAALYVIDTTTHTALGFANVFPAELATYGLVMEPSGSKLWVIGAGNRGFLVRVDLNPAGVPQYGSDQSTLPGITSDINGLAVPQTPVTNSFLATIVAKSGTTLASRTWALQLKNIGNASVLGTMVTQVTLTQSNPLPAAACTPVVTSATPIAYGNLAPGDTGLSNLAINFTGCDKVRSRFTLTVKLGFGPQAQTQLVGTLLPM